MTIIADPKRANKGICAWRDLSAVNPFETVLFLRDL